jgi:oligopeptide/dipeptide ABC transporter ATP-binding protein
MTIAPHQTGAASGAGAAGAGVIYQVRDLRKWFPIRSGLLRKAVAHVQAVDGLSFDIRRGETVGLVGESGCGKTTTGRLMLRLLEPTEGSLRFDGEELTTLPYDRMKKLRGEMQIIFQDPYASLNPRLPVGDIIGEGLRNMGVRDRDEREQRVSDMLERVGLRKYYINRYPHEFSGGQRQRIGIARALVLRPKFIVADEPVSALDVSIQSQVLNLLKDLQDELNLTYLFISHNLQVVQHVSDRIGVMYLGKLVELAPANLLYSEPRHPYTQALLSAIPLPDPTRKRERILLRGDVPSAINPPSGCRFHTRCPRATQVCSDVEPPLAQYAGGHLAACHHPLSVSAEEIAGARRSDASPLAAGEELPQVTAAA